MGNLGSLLHLSLFPKSFPQIVSLPSLLPERGPPTSLRWYCYPLLESTFTSPVVTAACPACPACPEAPHMLSVQRPATGNTERDRSQTTPFPCCKRKTKLLEKEVRFVTVRTGSRCRKVQTPSEGMKK
uniref:Uncharacterized protein n=1 Tax=Molossus molossus TaxID=27622 RepID=A0A7J8HHY7_MOLMO|nr:hypothetical protein HJG59_010936 [Molossus molossus]